jgi:hypothetical protein
MSHLDLSTKKVSLMDTQEENKNYCKKDGSQKKWYRGEWGGRGYEFVRRKGIRSLAPVGVYRTLLFHLFFVLPSFYSLILIWMILV